MFAGTKSFNHPLKFDTRNVTDMSHMFQYSNFNSPLLFNTRKVETMEQMFYYALKFNQSLLFDMRNVTNAADMFTGSNGVINHSVHFQTFLHKYGYVDGVNRSGIPDAAFRGGPAHKVFGIKDMGNEIIEYLGRSHIPNYRLPKK
jgi:hypothetical protein